jgi:hypothetical protein
MEWRFRALTPNDTRINATHLEFFRDEALTNAVDALVREDLQNRLDAHAEGEPPVEVRYRFSGPHDSLSPARAATYLNELRPHLDAPGSREELDAPPAADEAMSFLVIEDFNTTGLAGDPDMTSDPEAGAARNDFYWFIRNVGRSGKKGGDRGRWGLGKIVYPASSRLRSFFAYTVRRRDQRRLLIGRSVLAVHRIGGTDYESEGYFGRFDDGEFHFFATPETDAHTLDTFCADFGITRRPEEPGVSLVVPFPAGDLRYQTLTESVIDHYFLEILRGRLVVRVSFAGEETVLSSATVEDVVRVWKGSKVFDRDETLARIAFAREAMLREQDSSSHFVLAETGSPRWGDLEQRFANAAQITEAKRQWLAGNLLSFDVPVRVARTDGSRNELSTFRVYLQRDEASARCAEYFIRDGLAISGVGTLREPGVRALVIIEHTAIAELLGDSENPAHTHWLQTTKHFRGKYKLGPTILSFVKNTPTRLVSFLSRRDEALDTDLLQHLFSVPLPEGEQKKTPRQKPGTETTPPKPPPPAAPSYIACERVDGGFVLRPSANPTAIPDSIVVRLAYETLRGNPFKLHHPADFDLVTRPNALEYSGRGVELDMLEANRCRIKIQQPDFQIRITGFDPHRDLIVDARAEIRSRPAEGDPETVEEAEEEPASAL